MKKTKNKQKIILVTGGAGFIGSHLIERLVADSANRVISLDNYFTGKKANHIKGAEYRRGHTKDIEKHISETPDIIYHLGEYSRTAVSIEEPNVVFDMNTIGTIAVLEFWRKNKCKLVYAGSSTKFADKRADGIEGRDLSPYTWSKASNTELVANYGKWYELPHATVYFSNVYGPRENSGRYGTVIEIFKEQYLTGIPRTVRLPGTQKRIYTHVTDTINALLLIGEKGVGDGYNIASDEKHTTQEVAELFGGEMEMLPARKTSRPDSTLDLTLIKKLGWKAKHSLKEYIKEIKNPSTSSG
ncbi:MAG: NAD-dependent epimerase/dehydratase family protein [Candidatus Paceibacterota bacterium]|jgi:UDP-glucose 4-epimerase